MDNPALGEKSGMQHNGRAGAKGVFEVLQLLGYHWEQDIVAQWDQAKKKKKNTVWIRHLEKQQSEPRNSTSFILYFP